MYAMYKSMSRKELEDKLAEAVARMDDDALVDLLYRIATHPRDEDE